MIFLIKHYCEGIRHRIRKGDTLYKISKCYNVPLNMILKANEGVDIYNLKPGSTICIPDNGTWQEILTNSCVYNGMYENTERPVTGNNEDSESQSAYMNNNENTHDIVNQNDSLNDSIKVEEINKSEDTKKKNIYTVLEGDTLEDVLDKTGMTVSELIKYNYETGIPLKSGVQLIVSNN